MAEILIINISGEDKPGLTSSITGILANHNANILDIGQAVIHNTLSLGILIEIPQASASSPILKDVLLSAHNLGVTAKFSPIHQDLYTKWVDEQGKKRNIATLLTGKLTANQISRISGIIADNGLNIDNINRISGRIHLGERNDKTNACVEFSFRGSPRNQEKMRRDFLQAANELGIDIALQEDNIYRSNRRLVAFDMDSTLIEIEVINELAKAAGVGNEVSAITERAMRGEIDFSESFKQRVKLLKGLDQSVLENIARDLPLTEGAERLVQTLKKLDFTTAIISGGFTYFGTHLQNKLGIDYVYANQLEISQGKITGNVIGEIIDGNRKALLLEHLAEKEKISLEQVIAVGDGANDIPMLSKAGLGIAFRAKPIVQENAEQAISTLGLDGILYLIGFRDWYSLH
ncbi:MAG: phosphoserine phosphatase SerB [Proteobacteria bacterium]|nr:phosphoserine phosphatase SerB [Pseudomonadota bacterium]